MCQYSAKKQGIFFPRGIFGLCSKDGRQPLLFFLTYLFLYQRAQQYEIEIVDLAEEDKTINWVNRNYSLTGFKVSSVCGRGLFYHPLFSALSAALAAEQLSVYRKRGRASIIKAVNERGLLFSSFQINLVRRRTPVLLQTYLPSGLFVVVSWISFIVPPEVVPGTVGPT